MGSFRLCVSSMQRVCTGIVLLSVQLFAGFSKSCDCNAENLLLNRLDKLNEDIAKLVRDDMHFDGNHVAFGPSDIMSNGFVYRRKRSENEVEDEDDKKRAFGGYLNRNDRAFGGWMDRNQRAFGGWKNRNKKSFGAWKNRNRRAFGGWIDKKKRNMDNW